jgi:hypothetical protein
MLRVALAAAAILAASAVAANLAHGRPMDFTPPSEQRILAALPPSPPWITREVDSIERELIRPGRWKCRVFYVEVVKVGWIILPYHRYFVQDIYFGR